MPSDIARLLNQRGHKVTKEGSERDIFLPTRKDLDAELVGSFKVVLYNLMRHDSFRRTLRDWSYGRVSANGNSNIQLIESYVRLCEKFGSWDSAQEAVRYRYSCTFEWYVSELLRREFAARASGFGLRLKDADPDDEFDCVALLDAGLVFVECKTGREDIYAQIGKFLRRDSELSATYSFFVFDRDYTFAKTGDDVPQLSWEQAYALGVQSITKVTAAGHTFFQFLGLRAAAGWRYLLACSAFNGFEDRIRYMIRYCNETSERRVPSPLFASELIPFTPEVSDTPPAQPDQVGATAEQGTPTAEQGTPTTDTEPAAPEEN
jgi:hypothetical protein